MEVLEILNLLQNRLVDIQVYRNIVKDVTKEELNRLSEYIEQVSEAEDEFVPFLSLQSMHFQDLTSGEIVRYGFIESNAEHRRGRVSEQKNRQYGWLLVEAYEEFEDFLERIYAQIGKTNQNAWRLEDFGRVKLSELDDKPFEWYLDKVRSKYRSKHRDLLTRIRELYPELKSVEEKNIYNVHIRVAIELIENLRHRIVHARGSVDNLDEFVAHILKNCGLWNNGKPKPGLRQFIEGYFYHNSSGAHTVWLGERRAAPPEVPLDVYHDVWDALIVYLIAYAYSICNWLDPTAIPKVHPEHPPLLSPRE